MFERFGYRPATRDRFDGHSMSLQFRPQEAFLDGRCDLRTNEKPQANPSFSRAAQLPFPRRAEVKSQLRRMHSWASRRKAEIEKGTSIRKA